jgi:predicted metal-dependent phosphoesterase TrpH
VPRPSRHALRPEEPVRPSGPSTIDFHTHTNRSDGVLEPVELAAAAAAAGVRLLAITDHDTLAGVRALRRSGHLPGGLELVDGVEINTVADDELHVIGLGVDPDDAAFEATLARQRHARRVRFNLAVARLREFGLPIDAHVDGLDLRDDHALGRPTLARALVAAGYATSVEDAFSRYLLRGMAGYVPREGLGPADTIGAIRSAGGLAVLAHFGEAPARLDQLLELRDLGIGGLEVYYRTFERRTVDALEAIARDLRLVPTGGSDYHGDTASYAEVHAGLWVPPQVGSDVLEAIARDQRVHFAAPEAQ